jgi:LmbE family N-acetylglucosaminyl deacetylase
VVRLVQERPGEGIGLIPISLSSVPDPGSGLTVLCLGAHADDIEIGAGGTLLQLLSDRSDVTVRWVVFSGTGERADEARSSAERFLEGARDVSIAVHDFPDGLFPGQWTALKHELETLKETDPHLVLTHRREDRHQDHRTLSDITWSTFRRHVVLEYEIPKYDGDLAPLDLFVPLDEAVVDRKIRLLMDGFATQRERPWFSEQTFRGLMRLRGVECAAHSGYAEAFRARKLVLATG